MLAAVLRFSTLGGQSLWYDETVTASLVRLPFDEFLRALPDSETAPPLYYVLAWIWARVFGSSDLALRSLSAVIGTLVVPAAFLAARELVSRRTGILVALFATVSPLLVWYSQEARAYSLLVLLSTLSLYGFARVWSAVTEAGRVLGGRVLPCGGDLLLRDLPRLSPKPLRSSPATLQAHDRLLLRSDRPARCRARSAGVRAGTHGKRGVDRRNPDGDSR